MRRGMVGRRRGRLGLAVLGSLLVVAAACASGGGGEADGSPSTTEAPAPDATGPSGAGGGAGGGSGSPSGAPGGGGAPSGAPGTTAAPDVAPELIGVGSLRVGEVAPALLRPGRGDRVVFEVRAQQGATPRRATLDHVRDVLAAASGKSVAVDGVDALTGGARDWTHRDIVAAAASAAQHESGRDQVVLRVLFLRGTYEGDTGVLGVAVAGDVAAVFSDRVEAAAGILVDPSVIEDAVTMHEVGHLLGLVDLLLGTGRGDPEHPGHSRNKRSVMYWQVESGLITQLLDGGIPRDFDDADRAELAQIRAG